jgi:hypothetical protein
MGEVNRCEGTLRPPIVSRRQVHPPSNAGEALGVHEPSDLVSTDPDATELLRRDNAMESRQTARKGPLIDHGPTPV